VERNGTKFVFVDTAGIRRKGKTKEMAEKLSVVMARRHIRLADIVLVVMDAGEVSSRSMPPLPDTRTKAGGP